MSKDSEGTDDRIRVKDMITSSFEGLGNLEFVEDLALPIGGCIIETGFGSLDCSIDKQCDELIKSLNYLLKNR
jgi:flagellar biosynthesis/type III secretory pathway protein FliH